MLTSDGPQESKGQRIKRLTEERFSPSQRDSLEVVVTKDTPNLTRIRIRRILKERDEGNMAVPVG